MEILHQLDGIASFIWEHAVFVVSIILVYAGTRELFAHSNRRNAVAALTSGVLLMALMASLSLWVSHTMSSVNTMLSAPTPTELPTNWGANQTPEAREKNSRSFASVTFTGSGQTVKYFDREAGWQRYCPTDEDLALREQAISLKHQSKQLAEDSYTVVFNWLTYGMVAAGLGVFSGRRRSKCSG